MSVFHDVAAAFLHPGGPYLFIKLVTACYVVSAIGRMIPVRHKQVPGYRPRPGRAVRQSAGILAVAAPRTACAHQPLAGAHPAEAGTAPPAAAAPAAPPAASACARTG